MRYGNEKLLEASERVWITGDETYGSEPRAVVAYCDAAADAFARRGVCLITTYDTEVGKAVATAAQRHAGPIILVGSKPLAQMLDGDGKPVLVRDALTFEAHPLHLHPVRPARVWAEDFDPESLYVWGEGLKRFINRTYTHQVILTACDIRKSMAFVPGGTWNIDTGIRPDDICRNVLAMRGGNETCIT